LVLDGNIEECLGVSADLGVLDNDVDMASAPTHPLSADTVEKVKSQRL